MTDIVLVHGTTQSPAGWDRLAKILTGQGHRSHTVDLVPGVASTAREYADLAAAQLPPGLTAPVVVAHSAGGMLLPAVSRRLGARHQVWLAAYVPDGRHALIDEMTPDPTELFNTEWVGVDPTADPVLAAYFLFHDCDLATLRWALGTVRLFAPASVYREPVEPAPDIGSTYVVGTADRTLRPDWCRRAAANRLGVQPVEIDAGHCPHVSRPDETAAVIDRAARTNQE